MAQTVICNSPEVHEQNVVADYPQLKFGIVREVRVLCMSVGENDNLQENEEGVPYENF